MNPVKIMRIVRVRNDRYIGIWIFFILSVILLSTTLGASRFYNQAAGWGLPGPTDATLDLLPVGDGPWVVRAMFTTREMVNILAQYIEPWEVDYDTNTLVVMVDRSQAEWMQQLGFQIVIDPILTYNMNQPRTRLPGQITGIPGYPCYRTVEETYTTGESLASAYPSLAAWLPVGVSWEKQTPGDLPGYDLYVLRLTNVLTPGPKPRIFILSSIHAREYTPAELNTRFAEYLLQNYGTDADVTWLLDYHEIHLLLQGNPDGRKLAETGLTWRKNTHTGCTLPDSYGVDLNRNFEFQWNCCNGSSGRICDETYRGQTPASEPETQAIQNYARAIFADQRENDLVSPALLDTSGIFLDLHSYSNLVLWPWGFDNILPPNADELQTLGKRLAYFNNYTPQQAIDLYPTDGTTDDFTYGDLGVASYTFEMGTTFFQGCATFENTILPANIPALVYAARVARYPYITPSGPDSLDVTVSPTSTLQGSSPQITAVIDDTRFRNTGIPEPSQNITAAEYYIDIPPWDVSAGPISHTLSTASGSFDAKVENVTGYIATAGLSSGRHIVFVRGQDASGNWGPVSATFFYVQAAWNLYLPALQH